jgi:hypothetical protein
MKKSKAQQVVNTINISTGLIPVPPTYLGRYLASCRDRMLIAFDIETDTAPAKFIYPNGTESNHPSGLDPRVSSVTCIAATDGLNSFVVDAPISGTTTPTPPGPRIPEAAMVGAFTAWFAGRDSGFSFGPQLVGWNTSYFDAPFLRVRGFNEFSVGGMQGGDPDSDVPPPKYGFPEWATEVNPFGKWNQAYLQNRIIWDISHFFKEYALKQDIKHSLKPVCKSLGIDMVEVNAEEMHKLTPAQVREYNLSDAYGTWRLAKMVTELYDAGEL